MKKLLILVVVATTMLFALACGRDETAVPPATTTFRPCAFCSNSLILRASKSMTPAFKAALAERLAASRTAFSAQSALRPRISARDRM